MNERRGKKLTNSKHTHPELNSTHRVVVSIHRPRCFIRTRWPRPSSQKPNIKVTRWVRVHVAKFQVFSEDGAAPWMLKNLLKRKPHNKYFSSSDSEATKTRRTMRRGSLLAWPSRRRRRRIKLTFITNAFLNNKASQKKKIITQRVAAVDPFSGPSKSESKRTDRDIRLGFWNWNGTDWWSLAWHDSTKGHCWNLEMYGQVGIQVENSEISSMWGETTSSLKRIDRTVDNWSILVADKSGEDRLNRFKLSDSLKVKSKYLKINILVLLWIIIFA